jgi:hypothetical protein
MKYRIKEIKQFKVSIFYPQFRFGFIWFNLLISNNLF